MIDISPISAPNLRIELKLLRDEMMEESCNCMKKIIPYWTEIKKEYGDYRGLGLTPQESFYCSLMDCGLITLEDLKNEKSK